MKVKDLIKMDIDVDVYDNVTDDGIAVAFCGPLELTDAGKAEFEIALNLYVELDDGVAIVNVDDGFFPDNWKFNLKNASRFFWSAAGYCNDSDCQRWFK